MQNFDLASIISQCGVKLYDSELTSQNSRTIYRVYIIKDGGVSLEDCEKVSRVLSPIFDVMAPVEGEYFLEVSSPGLERKLSKIEHFALSLGEEAKITLNDKSVFIGKIISVDGEMITFSNDDGKSKFSFNEIKKAKTFIQW
ncbi:DUF150 domain-containing protein [Candidatus Campylobacter infans]|uniref:Ribosome maturation factor RimP n=1 Tax=Candidatus Campylobacter infans TaxID=2561898 RepID=A0A7H9CJE0_9BACT|nr:ribosome maturation factor RimP [Candidatus Campylobacter infans]QLI06092.1 DUF150 domain-containing protein [Candidatus Campylobacter infans]